MIGVPNAYPPRAATPEPRLNASIGIVSTVTANPASASDVEAVQAKHALATPDASASSGRA